MSNPTLPIRRLTLYKHGVAYVQREGALEGEHLNLAFRPDEIDDALKSLAVFDKAGGRVVCIDYDTPEDSSAQEGALQLRPGSAMLDLLNGLTGWDASIQFEDARAPLEGRIAGLQFASGKSRVEEATLLVTQASNGGVRKVSVASISEVVPIQKRVSEDLNRQLDARQRAKGQRAVTVRLTPGSHKLAVSYLIPSAAWRVSYRVVAEAAADGRSGRLLLQGWGLVDNRLDDDLVDVSLSLVAGQPISFKYDLSTPHIPWRHTVADETRQATGPVEYSEVKSIEALNLRATSCMSLPPGITNSRASLDEIAEQHTSAQTNAMGEMFGYDVTEPVTIPRGASALVPILQAGLAYRRELLFNEDKHPGHPVAALRCTNGSGLVLERGPVTVVEDDTYRGEAIVPFTGLGGDLYLPYAIELGVAVRVSRRAEDQFQGIELTKELLFEQSMRVIWYDYELENRSEQTHVVVVERSKSSLPGTLHDCPEPRSIDGAFRWEVTCPPSAVTRFVACSREQLARRHKASDLSYADIVRYLAQDALDPASSEILRALVKEFAAVQSNETELRQLRTERDDVHGHQEHLRENIQVLDSSGPEAATRLGMVKELQLAEERLGDIERRCQTLRADTAARKKEINDRTASASASKRGAHSEATHSHVARTS